jgi:hypothetical protein
MGGKARRLLGVMLYNLLSESLLKNWVDGGLADEMGEAMDRWGLVRPHSVRWIGRVCHTQSLAPG